MNTALSRMHLVVARQEAAAPSGGDVYHRRLRAGLAELGWSVTCTEVPGAWPRPSPVQARGLARTLEGLPDGAVVLLDGLVACGVPDTVVPRVRGRLRAAVLMHSPLAIEGGLPGSVAAELERREREMLHAVEATVATSNWAARYLASRHGLAQERIHVAEPGTEPAPLRSAGPAGNRLTCAASLGPRKGQDLLLGAAARLGDLDWHLTLAGGPGPVAGFPEQLAALVERHGLGGRVSLLGPVPHERLPAVYAQSDLVVLPSRAETFGMVVTEGLARGIPILATDVGGVAEALGRSGDGERPGLLVPPEEEALAEALRRWLEDPLLRRRLERAARDRRTGLTRWEETTRLVARALRGLGGGTGDGQAPER